MTEHIQGLRREIAEISKESSEFLRSGKKDWLRKSEQDRRVQRLKEIKEELDSLTARKAL
jgi:hypothetical protein